MNALHLDGWRDLYRKLDRTSEEARVAVITATGEAFYAGDDIGTLDSMESADDVSELASELRRVLFGIEELPAPVISAVNELAYGGGCEIAAASDLAVAVEDARFALPETRIGAYPPYAVERMAELVGKKRSRELALTGEPIDAETALEWGLVNRVVPRSELTDAVSAFVDDVVRSPKESIRLAKRHALAGKPSVGDEVPDRRGARARPSPRSVGTPPGPSSKGTEARRSDRPGPSRTGRIRRGRARSIQVVSAAHPIPTRCSSPSQ